MKEFTCGLPCEIVFGDHELQSLSGAIGILGRKCLLVSDPFFVQSGLCDESAGILRKGGIQATVFSKVSPNPRCMTSTRPPTWPSKGIMTISRTSRG